MEVEEGARNGTDVTVYLVPKSTTSEQGRAAKKRKHSRQPPLEKIHAESSRLRECSKYFDTCMSRRWTQGEFYLKAQTEVKFYHDCFARMYTPFMPIESVDYCIQLLSVASQIQCDEVMDVGLRYLAAVSWSDEEEEQIRSFCTSGQLSCTSTSELFARLQSPLKREERQLKLLNALSGSLQSSFENTLTSARVKSRNESRKVFHEAFQAVVSGSGPGQLCRQVREKALTLVTKEFEKLLVSIKKGIRGTARNYIGMAMCFAIGNLRWFLDELRMANAAQAVVEQIILKDEDIAPLLQTKFQSITLASKTVEERDWAVMMQTIFEDVLDGKIFLKTSERLALFYEWNWLLKADNFGPDAPFSPALVYWFIMTFPHSEQDTVYRRWLSSLDDPANEESYCDLSEAYSMWMKHLLSQAEKLDDAPNRSNTTGTGASSSSHLKVKEEDTGGWERVQSNDEDSGGLGEDYGPALSLGLCMDCLEPQGAGCGCGSWGL